MADIVDVVTDHRQALGKRTQTLMAESGMPWKVAWRQAEADLGPAVPPEAKIRYTIVAWVAGIVGVVGVGLILGWLAPGRPTQVELGGVFDLSIVAVSDVLGDPVDSPHRPLDDWHESSPGGVNCRMHRHATWDLGSIEPDTVIRSFEPMANEFGDAHSMAVIPLPDSPSLKGEPRTNVQMYDGYTSWLWATTTEEGQFRLTVEGEGC